MRRAREEDEDLENLLNKGALWAVTYGDVMSYLMILFLIMFSFTYSNHADKSAVSAIEKAFSGSTAPIAAETPSPETPAPAKPPEPPALKDELAHSLRGIQEIAKIEVAEDAVRLSFQAPVLFDTGSASLKKSALPQLEALAASLKAIPNPVHIEGHTDNVPPGPHAPFKSNWELSSARAFSVLRFFVEHGIPPERLAALGYGEFQPAASNDTAEGRAANRRIEIEVIRKKAAP